jgi:hypothetical protein
MTADGAAGITFLDEQTLARITDGTWRRVACNRFRIDPALEDGCLLPALLTHPQYRDPYYLPSLTTEPIHGPYNLVRIALDSFTEPPAHRPWPRFETG